MSSTPAFKKYAPDSREHVNSKATSTAWPAFPHVRFFDSRRRGYVAVDLTRERMEARFQVISDRRDPKATVSTLKRFVVESGKAGAVEL